MRAKYRRFSQVALYVISCAISLNLASFFALLPCFIFSLYVTRVKKAARICHALLAHISLLINFILKK